MTEIHATNITWHEGHVKREDREKLLAQKGVTIWFTGLSGAGKSTIAFTLEHALVEHGQLAYVLDGDDVRHGLNKKARAALAAGKGIGSTGVDDAYEPLLSPEIVIHNDRITPQEAAQVMQYMESQGLLPGLK